MIFVREAYLEKLKKKLTNYFTKFRCLCTNVWRFFLVYKSYFTKISFI
uniref:Uncharacterized protein n=1 Tax=Globisporangium ultimum (strain ATCC 200006 / CBS 805.95 / DAOM BR144) TaxID=431595 RepID=K3XCY8_GLOUD